MYIFLEHIILPYTYYYWFIPNVLLISFDSINPRSSYFLKTFHSIIKTTCLLIFPLYPIICLLLFAISFLIPSLCYFIFLNFFEFIYNINYLRVHFFFLKIFHPMISNFCILIFYYIMLASYKISTELQSLKRLKYFLKKINKKKIPWRIFQ